MGVEEEKNCPLKPEEEQFNLSLFLLFPLKRIPFLSGQRRLPHASNSTETTFSSKKSTFYLFPGVTHSLPSLPSPDPVIYFGLLRDQPSDDIGWTRERDAEKNESEISSLFRLVLIYCASTVQYILL